MSQLTLEQDAPPALVSQLEAIFKCSLDVKVRLYYSNGPKRNKPRVGGTKLIRGIPHVRQHARTACGAILKNGGRYQYVWEPVNGKEDTATRSA